MFTATLPKLRLVALTPIVAAPGPTDSSYFFDLSPDFAVNVTVCGVLDAVTEASKLALVVPEATVTDAGTVTAVELLARLTADPLLSAAVFRLTVQTSVPDPVMEPWVHDSPLTIATPSPDRPTLLARPSDEVLVSFNSPLEFPAAVGSNCRARFAVSPGFKVIGNVAPEAANPVPDSVAAFTVTAEVPVDDKVTACVAEALTSTLPKSTLLALTVRIAVTAFNCSEKLSASEPTFAVKIAVCDVDTAATVAVKLVLVAPAATATVAGTTTALLLLLRSTVTPPVPAAALRPTEHVSDVEPVAEPLVQLSELNEGVAAAARPVPERPTTSSPPVDASLEIVSWPVCAPAALGLNWIWNAKVEPGLTLTGNPLWLVAEKEDPETVICEISTGDEPWFDTEMLVLADWPTGTEPNATDAVEALSVPVAEAAFEEECLLIDDTQPESPITPSMTVAKTARRLTVCCTSAQKEGHSAFQENTKVTI